MLLVNLSKAIVREREREREQVDLDIMKKMKTPYILAKSGKWEGFRAFFHEHKDLLDKHIDLHRSTPFHYAANSGRPGMYQEMLGMVSPSNIHYVLRMTDDMGYTPLHEVARAGEVDMTASILEYEVKEREETEYEPLLYMRSKLGETPVYRAASHGNTNLLKYFVENKSIDLRQHFHRIEDKMSILHIAVINKRIGRPPSLSFAIRVHALGALLSHAIVYMIIVFFWQQCCWSLSRQ